MFLLVEEPETLAAEETSADQRKERAKPCCSACKNPMKGHKNVSNCPKNKKND